MRIARCWHVFVWTEALPHAACGNSSRALGRCSRPPMARSYQSKSREDSQLITDCCSITHLHKEILLLRIRHP